MDENRKRKRRRQVRAETFHLNIKVDRNLSLNKLYSNCHWAKRKKDADSIHELVKYSLIEQGVKPVLFVRPVELTFMFNTRLDISNTAYAAKLIEDGLKGLLLQDDSKKHVRAIHSYYWDNEGILVTVKEVGE